MELNSFEEKLVKANDQVTLEQRTPRIKSRKRGRERSNGGSSSQFARIYEARSAAKDAMNTAQEAADKAQRAANEAKKNYAIIASEVRRLETRYGVLSHRDRIRAFDAEHPGWASHAEGPHHSSIVKNVTVGKRGEHIRPHRH